MIKSMTGFGRGEFNDGKRNIVLEIKTVNHRYSDFSFRMARRYSFLEEKIKNKIKEKIKRGKIDVSLMIENITADDITLSLNENLARKYMEKLMELKRELNVEGEVDLEYLAALPDVLKHNTVLEDEDELCQSLLKATEEALLNLDKMRCVEGEKLAEDLLMRRKTILKILEELSEKAADVPKSYSKKIEDRITELIGGSVEIPQDRIVLEAAIFADKCNVDEELTRLFSHMGQMEKIINSNKEAEGKKLDFLVQEMNREANTIGSKANNIEVTNLALSIKAEVEKIREQVQNIE